MKNWFEFLAIVVLAAVAFITFYRMVLYITNCNEVVTNVIVVSVLLIGVGTAMWKAKNSQ